LAFLVIWEIVYQLEWINPLFISSPFVIAEAMYRLITTGSLLEHIYTTLTHFTIGFLLAAVGGIITGLILGWYKLLGDALDPFLTAMIGTPRIVLLPLITLWFGVGLLSNVIIVFIASFFPIIINTMSGVRSLDQNHLRVARAFGAHSLQIFLTVALPGSVPHIVSGLRVGIGQALVAVIAVEMLISTGGIGYFVSQSSANFNIDYVFVGIIVVVLLGLFITWLVRLLEKRFESWRSN